MANITLEVSDEQMELWVTNELRRCYVDNIKFWRKEKDAAQLGDALLTVIEHYSSPPEYDEWYETIKDL